MPARTVEAKTACAFMPEADLCFAHAVGIRSCWASYGYGDCDTCRALARDFEIAFGAVRVLFLDILSRNWHQSWGRAARGTTFGARQARWRVAARPEPTATGSLWSRERTTSSMAYGPAPRRGIAAVPWWPLKCSGRLGAVQRGATDSSPNCVIFPICRHIYASLPSLLTKMAGLGGAAIHAGGHHANYRAR